MKTNLAYFTKYLVSTLLFFGLSAFADNFKNYAQLKVLDLDEMSRLIESTISSEKKTNGGETAYLEALKLLLSRPDDDGMRRKLLPPIKSEIEGYFDLNEAYKKVANETIKKLAATDQNGKKVSPEAQVTYAIVLENIISELKPTFLKDQEAINVLKLIAAAKIEISPEANNERKLRVLKLSQSPSALAVELLKKVEEQSKKKVNEKNSSFLPTEEFNFFKCSAEAKAALTLIGLPNLPEWQKVGSYSYSTKTYRAPLTELGHWVEVSGDENERTISFNVFTDKSTESSRFDIQCKERKVSSAPLELFKPNAAELAFDDTELKKVLASGKSGIIYLWSPRMPYSVTDFRKFKKMAKKMKMEFIPVLSHVVPFEEANDALASKNLEFSGRKMASLELYMRNGALHYPSMFVYSKKKLNPHRIIGIYKNDDFTSLVKKYSSEIQ